MTQNPATTVTNLIVAGRKLGVGPALNPPELVQGARSAKQALTRDGSLTPEGLEATVPLQVITWYMSGSVIVTSSMEREIRMPQASRGIQIRADAKGAPSSGSFNAELRSNGVFVDNVSITQGQTEGVSPLTAILPALGLLTVAIINTGGASSVTISLIYQPTFVV